MWRISPNKDWEKLEQEFDWVAEMSGVPQDPRFHAEGDVAVHTQMVLQELQGLEEYAGLSPQAQAILYAAALLHDVEKRSTTEVLEDGSIRSPRHAKRGEYTARRVIYESRPAPFPIREQVAKLVRYHGLPIWALEKANPQKTLLRCSWEVDTQWLYLLAKADVRGRISEGQDDFLERVEFFKVYCEEQDCWGQRRHFANDLARFQYFHKEGGYSDYVPFDDTRGEAIMLCGLPGAGKDTFARRHFPNYPMVSLDGIRQELGISPRDSKAQGKVAQVAKERMKEYMRRRQSFVFNATNLTRELRAKNIRLFDSYRFRVHIHYVEVSYRQLVQQNRSREEVVPLAVLERMLGKLEMPSLAEAHQVEYHWE